MEDQEGMYYLFYDVLLANKNLYEELKSMEFDGGEIPNYNPRFSTESFFVEFN